MKGATQMTTIPSIGAAPTCSISNDWQNLSWQKVDKQVFRLQMRIAKAAEVGKKGKVKALQHILTHSFYAKCLSIKRVTSNKGGNTPGIDGVIWRTDTQKSQAVLDLKRRGYKPRPLKRIYIPKKYKTDKLRPLSIPTLKDRAMQALWYMALLPIAEIKADHNTYGFRPKRSAHDAIEQCFVALSRSQSASYILEGDIHACFDNISHQWLLDNIPMDKVILKKFLTASFMENKRIYPTHAGTPQGGILSPTLAVMALSGIESKLKSPNHNTRNKEKINFVAYADDFIVTAANEALLKDKVIPILEAHLKEVGLELSKAKTKITSIDEGFNFLGFNIRKYNGKLLIKPAKESVKRFLAQTREIIKTSGGLGTDKLIYQLNPKVVGWTNYYRSVVASKTFSKVDSEIFLALKRYAQRRHPNKGMSWITSKYFTRVGLDHWRFYSVVKDKGGKNVNLYLNRASHTKIRRHTKIIATATPFDSQYKEYFVKRDKGVNNNECYWAEPFSLMRA